MCTQLPYLDELGQDRSQALVGMGEVNVCKPSVNISVFGFILFGNHNICKAYIDATFLSLQVFLTFDINQMLYKLKSVDQILR